MSLIDVDFFSLFKRALRKDFSGNTGQALKNSIFQFLTNVFSRLGSLVFTIFLARVLLPENFGLYTLALSTILVFFAFTDLGIGSALVKYLSKYEKSKNKKSAYFFYLRDLKIKVTLLVSIILIFSSYFIANYYYKKPIFLALLAGSLYVLFNSFLSFIVGVFHSKNDFKRPFFKEVFYQISRLILVPFTIFFLIGSSKEILLGGIFLSLSFCFLFSIFFLLPKIDKYKKKELSKQEKKNIISFILPLSATSLTGIFFGSIDIIMLGRFVDSHYLAYYQISLALLGSISILIPFAAAFFPIFSRLSKDKLHLALKNSLNITFLFSLIAVFFTFLLSSLIIRVIYGNEYILSSNILKIFSILLVVDSLNSIYTNFFISTSRNNFLAKSLVFVTLLNIFLNFILIKYFLQFSMYYATIGAAIATILSRTFLLFLFYYKYKKI